MPALFMRSVGARRIPVGSTPTRAIRAPSPIITIPVITDPSLPPITIVADSYANNYANDYTAITDAYANSYANNYTARTNTYANSYANNYTK